MRLGPDPVGLRGFLLLVATGLVGIGLAVHGYGHGAVVLGSAGIRAPGSVGTSRASASAPSTQPTSPSAEATSPSPTAPSQTLGPLLSSTQYASYAYQIYPGTETSRARQATAGFTIRVTPRVGAIEVSSAVSGSTQKAQTATYQAGDRVYFIEATFGDDSGDADYNAGDDGVVVTNAQGYVVQ